jgi:hypothetical protein
VNPTEPPATTNAPPPAPQYEFDESQNRVIDDLAGSMRWVGIPLIFLGVVYLLAAVGHFARVGRDTAELVVGGIALLGAVFFFMLSSWLGKAADAFGRVTHTRGYDVTHLMNGLQNLRKTFRLLAVLVQIYLVLLLVLVVVFVVMALTRG